MASHRNTVILMQLQEQSLRYKGGQTVCTLYNYYIVGCIQVINHSSDSTQYRCNPNALITRVISYMYDFKKFFDTNYYY